MIERFINTAARGAVILLASLLLASEAHATLVTTRFSELPVSSTRLLNPERGVYRSGTSLDVMSCGSGTTFNQATLYSQVRAQGRTLAYDRIYLPTALRTRDFTTAELDCLRLNHQKAADYGFKFVERFAYSNTNEREFGTAVGSCNGGPWATQAQTKSHVSQVSANVWNPAKANIFLIESGWLGAFGESHNSCWWDTDDDQSNCGDMNEWYDFLIPKIPAGRKTTQRRAGYVLWPGCAPYNVGPTNPATGTANNDRLVAHSDGIAKNGNYGHTFDCSNLNAELNYWQTRDAMTGETDGVAGQCGGTQCTSTGSDNEKGCCLNSGQVRCNEIYGSGLTACPGNCDQSQSDCGPSKARLKRLHQVSLRDDDASNTHEVWAKWVAQGCANDIYERIGYRLRLDKAVIPDTVAPGASLAVDVDYTNEGYAAPLNARPVYLTLICKSGGCNVGVDRQDILTTLDPRLWASDLADTGSPQSPRVYHTITLSGVVASTLPNGVYNVAMRMPDPEPDLRYIGGNLTTLAKEVPFNIQLANDLGCSSAQAPCDSADSSKFAPYDPTTGVNIVGTTTVSGTIVDPPTCSVDSDCHEPGTDNVCTTDTCVPGGPTYPTLAGKLWIDSDGNQHDCDDIGASAVAMALIAKTGNAAKLAGWTSSDHHWKSAGSCGAANTGALREAAMTASTHGLAAALNTAFSPDFVTTGGAQSTGVFFNCTGNTGDTTTGSCDTSCQQCVDAMETAIRAATSPSKLWILEAGPADIIGRALNEATCGAGSPGAWCQYVTVISHNTGFNDIHSDNPFATESPQHTGWTFAEMQAANSTVTFTHIPDQNNNLQVGIGTWGTGATGWDTPTSPVPAVMQDVYDRIVAMGITDATKSGDVSDAGMTWWLVNGFPSTNKQPTPTDVKAVFSTTNGAASCTHSNNSASCTSVDGQFCNGADTCSGSTCSIHAGNPCAAGETCNETLNICEAPPPPQTPGVTSACDSTAGSQLIIPAVPVGTTDPHQILVCTAACEEDDADCNMDLATVKWGAAQMNRAVSKSTPADAQGWRSSAGIYYLVNPTPSTNDVTVQLGTAFEGVDVIAGGCVTLSGVEIKPASVPLGTTTYGGGGNYADPRNSSIGVPSFAPGPGALLIDVHSFGNPGTSTTTQGGQTELYDLNCGPSLNPPGADVTMSKKRVTAAGATLMGWDFSGTLNRDIHVIAAFKEYVPNPPTTTTSTTSTTVMEPPTTSTTFELPTTTTLPAIEQCADSSAPACLGVCGGSQYCVNSSGTCVCGTPIQGKILLGPGSVIAP